MADLATKKIKILRGAAPDLSAATFQIADESHTIGNALRWMVMKNPKVEFCGYRSIIQVEWGGLTICSSPGTLAYIRFPTNTLILPWACSVPHPSENHINIRIQMYDNLSALQALIVALNDLDTVCETIEDAYDSSLKNDKIERWDEKS